MANAALKPTPIPLARFNVVSTNDLDRLRQVLSSNYHPLTCDVSGNMKDFHFRYNHVFLNGISFSSSSVQEHCHIKSGPTESAYIMQLCMLTGAAQVSYGKSHVRIHKNGGGSIISPHRPCSWLYESGQSQLVVRIEREQLESYFRALTGVMVSESEPLEFQHQMDTNDAKIKRVQQLVRLMIADVDREGLAGLPLIQARMKDLLLGSLLYAQPHNYSDVFFKSVPSSGPHYIDKIEEHIKEHIDEPLRVSELAHRFGVNIRSMQEGFRRHRDYTLSEFIKETRLQRARELLTISPHKTVTQVALDCGFGHLSQFAADYQKRFGERPSETRRKSRLF